MPNANRASAASKCNKGAGVDPIYLRPGQVEARFGLNRSLLYLYRDRGWIRMVSLKPPGTRRGVALIEVQSVLDLIQRSASKPVEIVDGGSQ